MLQEKCFIIIMGCLKTYVLYYALSILSQKMELIRLVISQPILKIETSGFEANILEKFQNRHIIILDHIYDLVNSF